MAISYSEPAQLTCPDCGSDFDADVWLVLDAQEHPEQLQAIYDGTLNRVTCANCGSTGPAGAPLLFHDRAARQVIFAASPGAAEHEWREQVRELHSLLVGSIPIEERRVYLSDVQIAQDVGGIAHILRKAQRLRSSQINTSGPTSPPAETATEAEASHTPLAEADAKVEASHTPPAETAESSPLLVAIQALIGADEPASLQAVLAEHPILLARETDSALAQLSDVAFEQRAYDIAASLHHARQLLANIRAEGDADLTLEAETASPPHGSAEMSAAASVLPDPAYQALLRVDTSDTLLRTAQDYPVLLEPWVGDYLSYRLDTALDEGNENLAQLLHERRELLAEVTGQGQMQADSAAMAGGALDPQIATAIAALLTAGDEEAMAQALDEYPVLLTDAAQEALWRFASDARASGDEELAAYAVECRAMLRKVREGLEE
ncbi:MAG: CpXC domain-containing protein [Chloroflexales bacterium]|nr:CpXC domain-containing protein [Chloroflexales bacterium]